MPFVKLDCGILNSTLWLDREGREVFLTALLMAQPVHLHEPKAQLEIRTLHETGWSVPPGWYGIVEAAGIGIVDRAKVDRELGLSALERLGAPEPDSRSQAHEGRRLARVDGGYLVLNFFRYRDKDHGAAGRMRALRQRRKAAKERPVVTANSDTVTRTNVTSDGVTPKSDERQRTEDRGQRQRTVGIPAVPVLQIQDNGCVGSRDRPPNDLIDRAATIREGNELIRWIAPRVGLDPTEVLQKASRWKGQSYVRLDVMADDRLAHTVNNLRLWKRKLEGSQEVDVPEDAGLPGRAGNRQPSATERTMEAARRVLTHAREKRGQGGDR